MIAILIIIILINFTNSESSKISLRTDIENSTYPLHCDLVFDYIVCRSKEKKSYWESQKDCKVGYMFTVPTNQTINTFIKSEENKNYWLPMRRENIMEPYLTNASDFYNLVYPNLLVYGSNNISKNCVIYDTSFSLLRAVSCDDYHYNMCGYLINQYPFGYRNCNSTYGFERPFIKNAKECYYEETPALCKSCQIAEPYDLAEALIVEKHWVEMSIKSKSIDYRIGIDSVNNTFVFNSSGKVVDFINELKIVNQSGKYGVVTKDGMAFMNDIRNAMTLYQKSIKVNDGPLKIILKVSEGSNKMHVFVENPLNIYNLTIYCFYGSKDKIDYNLIAFHEIEDADGTNDSKNKMFDFNIYDWPRFYWCEALSLSSELIRSNVIYSYSDRFIRVYDLTVLFKVEDYLYSFDVGNYLPNISMCMNIRSDYFLENSLYKKKVIEYDYANKRLQVVYEFATNKSTNSDWEDWEYILNVLNRTKQCELGYFQVVDYELCYALYCQSDQTVDTLSNKTLHWPKTKIGSRTVPSELCLDGDYLPIWRQCNLNEHGQPIWSNVSGHCSSVNSKKESVIIFNDLLHSNESPMEIMKNVSSVQFNDTATVADISLLSGIFEKIAGNTSEVDIMEHILKTLDNVITSNRSVLLKSQNVLNSTDKLLDAFDVILSNLFVKNDYNGQGSGFIFVKSFTVKNSNIAGWAIDKDHNILPISRSNNLESVKELFKEQHLLVGLYMGNETLKELECIENFRIIVTFFIKDALFNEDTNNDKYNLKLPVIDVLIPGFNSFFENPVSIIYNANFTNVSCAYWHYGLDDVQNSLKGKWKSSMDFNTAEILVCNYIHLTHFSMLVIDSENYHDDPNNNILSILSIVGCSLSFVGCAIILITAIVLKKWRNEKSSIMFFHFIFSIVLTYIMFFVAENVSSSILCTISAMLLHYSVLSQFVWTLIFSYFQYNRLVVVFNVRISHAILKSSILAWSLPLVPIATVYLIDSNFYHKTSSGLCYLNGLPLKLSVLLPISITLLLNTMVLLKIVWSLSFRTKINKVNNEWKNIIKLTYVMFFFLGLNWTFGIVLAFQDNLVLSYIFTLTTTMQGFILCVIFFCTSSAKIRWKTWFKQKSSTSSIYTSKS